MRSFAGRNSVDSFDFGADPGGVDVKRHDSVDEFRAIAEPLYRRDPVAHTIELTLLRADSFPDDSLLLTVWDDGTPVGAALADAAIPASVQWNSRQCDGCSRRQIWLSGARI